MLAAAAERSPTDAVRAEDFGADAERSPTDAVRAEDFVARTGVLFIKIKNTPFG
jgi:hypothetical protein